MNQEDLGKGDGEGLEVKKTESEWRKRTFVKGTKDLLGQGDVP